MFSGGITWEHSPGNTIVVTSSFCSRTNLRQLSDFPLVIFSIVHFQQLNTGWIYTKINVSHKELFNVTLQY